MLPSINRLDRKEFSTLGRLSKKFKGEYGMIVIEKSSSPTSKFGFIVSKKIGNAVQRNRMTRLLREISKKYLDKGPKVKCIYIAYKYCDDYEKLEKDFDIVFNNAILDFKKTRTNTN